MKTYYGMTLEEYLASYWGSFELYFQQLLKDEGNYLPGKQARKIKDNGGATNLGISLRFLLSIGIQPDDLEADGDINNDGVIDEKDIVCLTKEQAKILYFKYFYNPLYDLIQSKEIANRIFNFGVNAGKPISIKIMQRTINEILDSYILRIDGIFGKKTLEAINGLDPKKLYEKYIINIELFYRSLNKPNFLRTWLRRLKRKLFP